MPIPTAIINEYTIGQTEHKQLKDDEIKNNEPDALNLLYHFVFGKGAEYTDLLLCSQA